MGRDFRISTLQGIGEETETKNQHAKNNRYATNNGIYYTTGNTKRPQKQRKRNPHYGKYWDMQKTRTPRPRKRKRMEITHSKCSKTGKTPTSVGKHISHTRKDKSVRIARTKVNCPMRNKEYRNLKALITHLQIKTIQMTWQPTTCQIITQDSLPKVK